MQANYRLCIPLAIIVLVSCAPTPEPTQIVPPHAGEWKGEISSGTGQIGSVSFKVTSDNTLQDFYFEAPFGMELCTIQQDKIRLENLLGLYFFELSDTDSSSTFKNKISGTFDGENSIVGEYLITYCPRSDGRVSVIIDPFKDKESVMYEWKAELTRELPTPMPIENSMVYVPAGEFEMGISNEQGFTLREVHDEWSIKDEQPLHTIYLDAYRIDRTEVTNEQYAQCVADGVCSAPFTNKSWTRDEYYGSTAYDNYPIIYVNWAMADAYCKWAGKRLPTEAEWEKAARGTDGRTFPWGEGISCEMANYGDCVGDTTMVGSYPGGASPYGVLDMTGNVKEWVADWYDSDYYQNSQSKNPVGPEIENGAYRSQRGGSFWDIESDVRPANRDHYFLDSPSWDFGFRCAATP
jgi:formylglycine-generating enzyme required for sulfatase activity